MNIGPKCLAVLVALGVTLVLPMGGSAATANSASGSGTVTFALAPGPFLDQLTESLFGPWRSCTTGTFAVSATSEPGGEDAGGTMSLQVCAVAATATVECLAVHGTQATVAGTVTSGNYLEPGTPLAFALEDGGLSGDVLGIAAGGCNAVPPITAVIGSGDIAVVESPPPDRVAPTLTVPAGLTYEARSPAGAPVSWIAGATDDRDPSPVVACSPPSGSTFSLGSTDVTCTATDAAGNTSRAVFTVTVVDTTPPVLVAPATVVADATSPSGAVVRYATSASDLVDPSPSIDCSPAAGSTFAIGDTLVTCTAVDASGNHAAATTFTVHVRPATEQIADVVAAVKTLDAKQGVVESLDAKLQNVLDALDSAKAGDRSTACKKLDAFVNEVKAQTGKALSQAESDLLVADAGRVKAVIGCG